MKIAFLFITCSYLALSFTSDEAPKDFLSVGGSIIFDNSSFHLAWSQKTDNYYTQEYLLEGDSLNGFTEMISVFVLNENIPVQDAIDLKIDELKEFKKTDPVCNHALTFGPKNGGQIIDFLRSETAGEGENEVLTVIEFNMYRYKQIKIGKNKKALLVLAYSKRAYGGNITPFLKSLKDGRRSYIEKLFDADLPEVALKN